MSRVRVSLKTEIFMVDDQQKVFDNIFLKKSPKDVRFLLFICFLRAALEIVIKLKAQNLVRYWLNVF